jgi:two-component system cell cycle response regulator DivK
MAKDKILIIDDDNRNIFALSAVLKAKKYQCVSATSAERGLEMLKENQEIGLVLMDMMMPGMDGYQAIAAMNQDLDLRHVPVIAVTAQAMPGDKEKCLNAGAIAYVSKPINVDLLNDLLTQYI